ncbi:MAG: helix-hairpin-helix domain-containing protein [bacterium]
MTDKRKLIDLVSVGPATLADFKELGITEVKQLKTADHRELFQRLQQLKGQKLDPCCKDVFRAAIEQARHPNLPEEKKNWYYWSKVRKGQIKK